MSNLAVPTKYWFSLFPSPTWMIALKIDGMLVISEMYKFHLLFRTEHIHNTSRNSWR